MKHQDTIVALASPPGSGAIAIIRLSGPQAIGIASGIFRSVSGKQLKQQATHTIHLGHILEAGREIDQVLASIFKDPQSYTGEDVVEFSCHGSPYIQQEIIQLCLRQGCRMAEPGEFTLRAFLNGKMDLSQAEAVADLIASDGAASHQLAMQQMRGGFASELHELREQLLNFASLIELELDFAEEDVEFADRAAFDALIERIGNVLKRLIDSFAIGNVIKNGIPVAIVGPPNVGKSTLLNALLNEQRAIVSDIAGTTRDTIEDEIVMGGIRFRFIDTAGIRETSDTIEELGIQKTYEKMEQAQVVVFMMEAYRWLEEGNDLSAEIRKARERFPGKAILAIANKVDAIEQEQQQTVQAQLQDLHPTPGMLLSAKTGKGVEALKEQLLNLVETGALRNQDTIVTNTRHYEALLLAFQAIDKVQEGSAAGLSGDLLAIDIREALYHIGAITGEISNDELLGNIFANFCIGK